MTRRPTKTAKKAPLKPVVGETWVRRNDLALVTIDAVTRRFVTVCVKWELVVFDYSHEKFHRYFRQPKAELKPDALFEDV